MTTLPPHFVKWEQTARSIDFKPEYVDIAGDLIAGLMLSQIVWYYLPTTETKFVEKKGSQWLVKSANEWYRECRLSKKRVQRGLNQLQKRGLLEVQQMPHRARRHIGHLRLNIEHFIAEWEALTDPSTDSNGTVSLPSRSETHLTNSPLSHLTNGTQRGLLKDRKEFEKTTLEESNDDDDFLTLVSMLEQLNQQLKAKKRKPLTALPHLAQQIQNRGEGPTEMRQAWATCRQYGHNPIAAFVSWINYGYLPVSKPTTALVNRPTRVNEQTGETEYWGGTGIGWVKE